MKIFMTGGTGYIGTAVTSTLRGAGHHVRILVRSETSAGRARASGAHAVRGDLREPAGFLAEVRAADGVIHLAHTGDGEAAETDDRAVRAMVDALKGSGKAFLYTSGIWVLGPSQGGEMDEESPTNPAPLVTWRRPLERWLREKADAGVRTVIIRPGIVYGHDGGIPGMMARGELPLVGDGSQRWPIVHLDDLTELYRMALESAPAGSVLHGITTVVPAHTVAEKVAGPDVASVEMEEARSTMGPFADALGMDQNISSRKTQRDLGWHPMITLSGWSRNEAGR